MERYDLFTGRQQGYHLYRIPALVVTLSGTVLAFCEGRRYTGRDDDEIDILLRRSFDGGRTWEARQTVISDADRTCGNPCPVVDGDTGTVFLPFCKDNQQVFVCRSDDDGETWSPPAEITSEVKDSSWSWVGTGPGHGIQLTNGRMLIPACANDSPGPAPWRDPPADTLGYLQSSYAFFSDDHGDTWERGAKMTLDASDEFEAVEMSDGTVYANMRSRQGHLCRASAWSRDGGETWSGVKYDPTLPEPSCQGSIVRFDADRILLSHPSHLDKRAGLTVRLSRDNCRTWPVSRVLEPWGASYSDMAVTDDGCILCFYEARPGYDDGARPSPSGKGGAGRSSLRLVLARFDIEWVENPA